MSKVLCIDQASMQAIRLHVRRSIPEEACGLLAGQRDCVAAVYAVPNVAPDPTKAFLADRDAMTHALRAIYRRGLIWQGIYHSHPPEVGLTPSHSDIQSAAGYPGLVHVIVGWGMLNVAAFSIRGSQVTSVDLVTSA